MNYSSRQNPDSETKRDPEKESSYLEASNAHQKWPRPTIALRVNENKASNCTRKDKRRPIHFTVETLQFALPCGVPNRRSYRRGYYEEGEQNESGFHPCTDTGMHRGLRIGEHSRVQQDWVSV
jgi:hypothetical protein